MKILLLTILVAITTVLPAKAGEPHWENHNGTLYWLDASGNWYYKGPAPGNWKDPRKRPVFQPQYREETLADAIENADIDAQIRADELEQKLEEILEALESR